MCSISFFIALIFGNDNCKSIYKLVCCLFFNCIIVLKVYYINVYLNLDLKIALHDTSVTEISK